MDNQLVVTKIASLEEAIKKATEAASKLLRCAESISNPQYVVTMDGQQLEILAAAHTAGVITLRVKSPFDSLAPHQRKVLGQYQNALSEPQELQKAVGKDTKYLDAT